MDRVGGVLRRWFKRGLVWLPLLFFVWLLCVYAYHLVFYRPLGFYFYDPVRNRLVKETLSYPFPLKDAKKQLETFFYQYGKGPENYLLKNVFLHGNSVESVFIYKNELNINFHSNVIIRLKNSQEEKNLIDALILSLKDQKNIRGSALYPVMKSIDKISFTFGGYPFKVVKGAYHYNGPFLLTETEN